MRLGQASGSLYRSMHDVEACGCRSTGDLLCRGLVLGVCVDLEGAVIERFVGM